MTLNTRLLKLNQDIRLRILSASCFIFVSGVLMQIIAVKDPGLKHVANKETGFTPGQPESNVIDVIASIQPGLQRNPKKISKPAGAACVSIFFSRLFASSGFDKKCDWVRTCCVLHQVGMEMFLTLGMPAGDESNPLSTETVSRLGKSGSIAAFSPGYCDVLLLGLGELHKARCVHITLHLKDSQEIRKGPGKHR